MIIYVIKLTISNNFLLGYVYIFLLNKLHKYFEFEKTLRMTISFGEFIFSIFLWFIIFNVKPIRVEIQNFLSFSFVPNTCMDAASACTMYSRVLYVGREQISWVVQGTWKKGRVRFTLSRPISINRSLMNLWPPFILDSLSLFPPPPPTPS